MGILLMAAGQGQRYRALAPDIFKLDAPLAGGASVFATTLEGCLRTGLPVYVVTRPEHQEIIDTCRQRGVSYGCHQTDTLADSIVAGVKACNNWNGWLVHLADMPQVAIQTFLAINTLLSEHAIARPVYRHAPGHPVGFARSMQSALLALTPGEGAKALLRRHNCYFLDIDDAGVVCDIDTPDDLDKVNVHAKFGQAGDGAGE